MFACGEVLGELLVIVFLSQVRVRYDNLTGFAFNAMCTVRETREDLREAADEFEQ